MAQDTEIASATNSSDSFLRSIHSDDLELFHADCVIHCPDLIWHLPISVNRDFHILGINFLRRAPDVRSV
jgi:hypothetical protein